MREELPWILRQRGVSSFAHDHLNHVIGALYEFAGLEKKIGNDGYSSFVADLDTHFQDLRAVHDKFREWRTSKEEPVEMEESLKEYVEEVSRLNKTFAELSKRAAALKPSLKFSIESHESDFSEALERLAKTPKKFDAQQLGKQTRVDLRFSDLHDFVFNFLQKKFFDRQGEPVKVAYRGKNIGRVEFDAQLLERSLQNLVTDAINHSTGRPVFVTLSKRSGKAAINVTNEGNRLKPDEIAKIGFKRFTQAMHDPQRGFGKISVRFCMEAQGGKLFVGNSKIGPLLSLRFPLGRRAA